MKRILPGLTWLILWILSWLPGFVFHFLAFAIDKITFGIFGYRKEVVQSNLSRSFPQLSVSERQEIERKFYRHFSELFLEIILLLRLNPNKLSARMRFSDPEIIAGALKAHQNIIIATGHFGNWEWNVPLLLASGYRVLAVYKSQSSRFSDQLMKDIRQKPGVILVPMKDTYRVISREINKSDAPFALILVADQIPARGDIRFWTTFLNQDSAFFTGIEKISKSFSLPVYYIDQVKNRFANYVVNLTLLHDGFSIVQKGDVTRKFAELLEKSIRRTPYLWLWSHRRWKYRREELPLKA